MDTETIDYTRDVAHAVTAWQMPQHLITGREAPELRPGESLPLGIYRFDATAGEVGHVPVAVLKHLLMPYGAGKPGNEHFVGCLAAGKLRFRRSDLKRLEYVGPLAGSIDPLLGEDESSAERQARLDRERALAEAKSKGEILDKELELERLRCARAADEARKAEADVRRAESEAKKAQSQADKATADALKAEAQASRSKGKKIEAE